MSNWGSRRHMKNHSDSVCQKEHIWRGKWNIYTGEKFSKQVLTTHHPISDVYRCIKMTRSMLVFFSLKLLLVFVSLIPYKIWTWNFAVHTTSKKKLCSSLKHSIYSVDKIVSIFWIFKIQNNSSKLFPTLVVLFYWPAMFQIHTLYSLWDKKW
jgi:hypothetical protein